MRLLQEWLAAEERGGEREVVEVFGKHRELATK
jgi:hypothetical protein